MTAATGDTRSLPEEKRTPVSSRFPWDNLTPWVYVPMWYVLRLVPAQSGDFGFLPRGGLIHPVLWEVLWLTITIGLIAAARGLSRIFTTAPPRVLIALVTYAAIPVALVAVRSLLSPSTLEMRAQAPWPESVVLSIAVGVIAVLWASPLSSLKTLELGLAQTLRELQRLKNSYEHQTQAAQRALKQQVHNVVAPEIEKVLKVLQKGELSESKASRLSRQIHSSVTDVLGPFSRHLGTQPPPLPKAQSGKRKLPPRRLSWREPVRLRDAVSPPLIAAVPATWLILVGIRDLAPEWPEHLFLAAFALTVVAIVFGVTMLIKAAVPLDLEASPLAAFFITMPITALLSSTHIFMVTAFPPDLLGFGNWGYRPDFPAAGVTLALISPLVSVAALLTAREMSIVRRREKAVLETSQHNSALRTELWHLQRQSAFLVHGPIQSALVSTRLRLENGALDTQETAELVALLEKTLFDLRWSEKDQSLEAFLTSLRLTWEGVATIRTTASTDTVEAFTHSMAALHAVCEVIREAVNNAIFHGLSTHINVAVSRLNDDTVHVRVDDNGVGPGSSPEPGLGTRLLDEVTTHWKLWRIDQKTFLTANLYVPESDKLKPFATSAKESRR